MPPLQFHPNLQIREAESDRVRREIIPRGREEMDHEVRVLAIYLLAVQIYPSAIRL